MKNKSVTSARQIFKSKTFEHLYTLKNVICLKICFMGRIVTYKPKPGNADALKELTKGHVPRLKKEGLVTDREPVIMEAADGTIIEVFEWLSDEAIAKAHTNAEVHKLWAEYFAICNVVPLNTLSEAGGMFATFDAVGG
jgi:hypothetical protein